MLLKQQRQKSSNEHPTDIFQVDSKAVSWVTFRMLKHALTLIQKHELVHTHKSRTTKTFFFTVYMDGH